MKQGRKKTVAAGSAATAAPGRSAGKDPQDMGPFLGGPSFRISTGGFKRWGWLSGGSFLELRYVGFDQTQNTRVYRFEKVVKGEPAMRLLIKADLALFLQHRIQLQEGPTLCANKLVADLENSLPGEHQ